MPIKSKNPKKIIKTTMEELKSGELNIGKSPKKVKKRSQAIAIALDITRKKTGKKLPKNKDK